jgi:hypothetical protein
MDPLHLKPIDIDREALLANLFASPTFKVLFFISMVLAVLLMPVTYWALDNQRPYIFDGAESYILPNPATGNDQMIVAWKVKVHRQCEGLIRRELFDPRTQVVLSLYDAQPTHIHTLPLGDQYYNRTFLLPKMIQTGRIGYRSKLEYYCNPLQRIWPIQYTSPELFFEVK